MKIPYSWLYLHYYDALTALFRLENALRMFVYVVLKNAKKNRWTDLTVTSDDGGETTIAAIAKRRLTQDQKFGYLGYGVGSPLLHLTSGELIRVILAEAYWPLFADFFPATKEIVRTKLEEIGNIRNALAHFRPIKSDDVEVVKQNANQVLARVEELLTNVTSTIQIVPTNTSDAWYANLKAATHPPFEISFQQSQNEQWIQVRLTHSCPHAEKLYSSDSYRQWSVLTIVSPNILRAAPSVLGHVIYAAETIPYFGIEDETQTPRFLKHLDLLFSRQTLSDSHEEIKADLVSVFAKVVEETELILKDSLARGRLVRSATLTSAKRPNGWTTNRDRLGTSIRDDDPVEYWSRKPSTAGDLITDTQRYPWMPVDVSSEDDEVPF